MAKKHPLLLFGSPTLADKERRFSGGGKLKKPAPAKQASRIVPQLKQLQAAFNKRKMALQATAGGTEPEQVLVIETIGSEEEFIKAVKKIEGLDWLGEEELEDLEPEFGFEDEKNPNKSLKGRLFLVMTDQAALSQIQTLFSQWQSDPDKSFPRGLASLKRVFVHLHSIRPWDERDRLRETGLIEDWEERSAAGQEVVPFEAELWFRDDATRRGQADARLRELIEEVGGEVIQQSVIAEVGYHAVLGKIPIEHAQKIAEHQSVRLMQCDDLMFLRPVGQCVVVHPEESDSEIPDSEPDAVDTQDLSGIEPVIAMFDGLPLASHNLLNGRLLIDDPDGYETDYPAAMRVHGTGMASLICHGDLSDTNEGLSRPVYARPILRPYRGGSSEAIPEDVLTLDLIHRAVRRLYETEGDEPAAAPGVRVINLSVGDKSRHFLRTMSPWARLLDWLAWKYQVLFIVSAGNHPNDIELKISREKLGELTPDEMQSEVISALDRDTRHRRLLSPAESVNGLTVGSTHEDSSGPVTTRLIDPLVSPDLPTTYSAHGPGYRRSVKPDISFPGGRQFVAEKMGSTHKHATLITNSFARPPGQKVATPGNQGNLNDVNFTRGTSNSAALATRACAQIHDVISELRDESNEVIPSKFDAVLIKAMLVHGAGWGSSFDILESVLKNGENSKQFKSYAGRLLGYGKVSCSKALFCTEQRATLFGVGELTHGDGMTFSFPLPTCLSATTEKRRLTITLAWFTPVCISRQKYRSAHLWFNPPNSLTPQRQESDHRAVQRGTVQHEILEGKNALDYQDGESLDIKINCRDDADKIEGKVKFAILATLEVAEGIDLPVYEQVKQRLQVPVPVSASG